MKLTKLELSGFKSFADSVTLDFEDGVTAIVGPNGCGKSNVSDAVRWVLGEQSARLLRGGKMEDVIFQGSAGRRPVNLTEVSLHLDNSSGELPIAYQEVVVTRRLSRSGQSEYLLNSLPVRLRDIQDLLRGTGLGSDAGVVIEAKMIDLLLSDRAEERRSLFEEAAGIGLYRDRKHSTERRLEETATDLQRLEDLIAEVQSQIRSLARQKGKAERHAKLMEEKFTVTLTLARRHLDDLTERATGVEERHRTLSERLPALRSSLSDATVRQDEASRARLRAEEHRTEIARQLAEVQVALSRLDGDLAVAGERLGNAQQRRRRDEEERAHATRRTEEAARERELAQTELRAAEQEQQGIQLHLTDRAAAEEEVRDRLTAQRTRVRQAEEALAARVQQLRSLEGERAALEQEITSLRERAGQAEAHARQLRSDLEAAEARARAGLDAAHRCAAAALSAAAHAERSRHNVAETREQETSERNRRRLVEESLAQLTTRRSALEELERDRVGLAPAAAALLAERGRFNGAVLGPLSDHISADRDAAELAERLLGEWMHAVLVRDQEAVEAIRRWHAETMPGALVLLPADTGPRGAANGPSPLQARLRAEGPAAQWVQALLGGSEVLDQRGHALRRASGAVILAATAGTSGPLRRRAEIGGLGAEIDQQDRALSDVTTALGATEVRLAEAERTAVEATAAYERAREEERGAVAAREDAARVALNLTRELTEADAGLTLLRERLGRAEERKLDVDRALAEGGESRVRDEDALAGHRTGLAEVEAEQEAARETRVHWQVQEAHVGARLRATTERLDRAVQTIAAAEEAARALLGDIAQLDQESAALATQRSEWLERRREQAVSLQGLEGASAEAEAALAGASAALGDAERAVQELRTDVDRSSEEDHRLEVELTEVAGQRRSIVERVEAEWKQPFEQLFESAQLLDLDRETLEAEAARIVESLDAIGAVNPLAVEEHAEESKRLEFLSSQRDDLVAARSSLLQAIREIDGTARLMFQETFTAVQDNFKHVFQTLFGGGECELKLANPDDPLESEIDIHAAPRGKRTQRIHLLSSGERTLVAVSLLFSIYLSKPSPFCLMDEVDAPLDDANVGRFTNLLDEFKKSTQFLVITHNPRTMQSADAVYGVTMQEPGVSTIVGVRLGEKQGAGSPAS
ncbi:MAG TPA: chromosome segregation protein SMC [Gemmatimonadales bacterium]|nr:chromosome segregation protein SMC [Gemmatimonadales bacterium]